MKHELKKPAAVLFDWDGTIVDSNPTLALALEATFADMEKRGYAKPEYMHWPLERLLAMPNFAPRRMLRDVFLPDGMASEAIEIYIEHYKRLSPAHTKVFDGAIANFLLLKELGIPFAIVSAKYQPFLDTECKAFLGPHFDQVMCLGESPDYARKPDPKSLHLALEKLGVKAGSDVWMIGDSIEADMGAAKNAGCNPLFMALGEHNHEPCDDYHIVSGHNSLRETLKKLHSTRHLS